MSLSSAVVLRTGAGDVGTDDDGACEGVEAGAVDGALVAGAISGIAS